MQVSGTPGRRLADQRSNIHVSIRCRPENSKERSVAASRTVVSVIDDRMLVFDPKDANASRFSRMSEGTRRRKDLKLAFDRVFDASSTQTEVYEETAAPLIPHVMEGYNATVFAYGATGAGKTHTMIGNADCGPGVMVHALRDLFTQVREVEDKYEFQIMVSYMEVYNEQIRDLLVVRPAMDVDMTSDEMGDEEGGGDSTAASQMLELCEDCGEDGRSSTVVIRGLSWHEPATAEELFDLLERGNTYRAHSPTEANADSSRSHAVLQIMVKKKMRNTGVRAAWSVGKLSMIDLAGSERASMTKNRGERLIEGANINRSLLALGNCINALCSGKSKSHIPYRDSKLTRLLKDSLGGNCRTVMIANVTPSSLSYEDTHNTLKYANRAKNIKTKVSANVINVNTHVVQYKQVIKKQEEDIQWLKEQLEQNTSAVGEITEMERTEQKRVGTLRNQVRNNAARVQELKASLFESEELEREFILFMASNQRDREATAERLRSLAKQQSSQAMDTGEDEQELKKELQEMTDIGEQLEQQLAAVLRERAQVTKSLDVAYAEFREIFKKISALQCSKERKNALQQDIVTRELVIETQELKEEGRRQKMKLLQSQEKLTTFSSKIEQLAAFCKDQRDILKESRVPSAPAQLQVLEELLGDTPALLNSLTLSDTVETLRSSSMSPSRAVKRGRSSSRSVTPASKKRKLAASCDTPKERMSFRSSTTPGRATETKRESRSATRKSTRNSSSSRSASRSSSRPKSSAASSRRSPCKALLRLAPKSISKLRTPTRTASAPTSSTTTEASVASPAASLPTPALPTPAEINEVGQETVEAKMENVASATSEAPAGFTSPAPAPVQAPSTTPKRPSKRRLRKPRMSLMMFNKPATPKKEYSLAAVDVRSMAKRETFTLRKGSNGGVEKVPSPLSSKVTGRRSPVVEKMRRTLRPTRSRLARKENCA